jgi:subtilisin family serine protease
MFRSKQPMKERKLAAVFVVKIFLLFAVEWAQSCQVVHHAAPGTKTTGNYIVVLNDETDHGGFEKIVDEIHKESPNSVIFEKTESPLIKMITANISAEAAQKICSLDDVESVEEEGYAHGSISWAIDRIDQTSSTLDGYSNSIGDGQGVKILLLDTGINYDHCEFGGRAMYAGYDPMDKRLNTSQNGKDCSGHGTHVASVAVGATLGVATKANIYSIRVLDCNGIGQWSAVIDGLIFAMEKIMSTETGQPFVILMPLEGPFSNAVDHTLKNILAQNIPIIAAAGNGKIDACLVSPGGTDGVISVGGSINGDGVYSDTNAGMCVDIFAPAGLVMGATHDCDACKCTSIQSGTSIGAGLVAGVVALYLQKESNLSTLIIEAKLTQNCLKNAMNFSTLPSSLIANTPNCLLHICKLTTIYSCLVVLASHTLIDKV